MRIRTSLVAVMFLLVMMIGKGAVQANAFGGTGAGGGFVGLKALMSLNLSDTQKADVAALISAYRPEATLLMEQVKAEREVLRQVYFSGNLTESDVRDGFRKIAPLLESLLVMKAQFMLALKSVLTTQQLRVLESTSLEMRHKMEERRQFGQSLFDAWLR